MDSQDSSAAPQHHHHHHQVQHQSLHHLHVQQQQQPPSAMLVAATQNQLQSQSHHHHHSSYPLQNPMNSNNLMRQQQQQQQQQQQHNNQSASRFFNSMMAASAASKIDYSDGAAGSSSPTGGAGGGGGFNIEPSKKKRGRPRKYSPDAAGSSIALGLSPTSVTPISSGVGLADSAGGGGGGGGALSSDTPSKKHRGRPPGSGKRQLDALGAAGIGFTPHVITVKTGEDIASKILAFSQQGPRTVCILSANGAICNVTLRQPAMSGGTVTYEGRFEIISLSGSFLLSENSGSRSRSGGLSVSLAGPDGRVLGGGVAGMLMAASTVQVVVGSFIADGKKPKSGMSSASAQSLGGTNILSFGNPGMDDSPTSQGGSSDSSDDHASPMDRSGIPFGNPAQAMQSIPMYTSVGWANSAVKMHPN